MENENRSIRPRDFGITGQDVAEAFSCPEISDANSDSSRNIFTPTRLSVVVVLATSSKFFSIEGKDHLFAS